jgi:hypothetical protein
MTLSPTLRHDVVTFALKKSEVIHPECKRHKEQRCGLFCEQCDFPVCQECILSGAHENHKVPQISEIHSSRKELIKRDSEEFKTNIAPVFKSIISELEEMLSHVVQKHGERQKLITEFKDRCHALVDRVIDRYLRESQKMETEDKESLQTLKSEFEVLQSYIQATIDENHSILSCNEFSKFTSYTSRIGRFRYIPKRFQLTVPPFKPGELTEQFLCQLLGDIPSTIKTDIPKQVLLSIQEQTSTGNEPKKKLMNEPEVLRRLQTSFQKTFRVHCIPGTDQFYVSGNSGIIKRMNSEGTQLEIIKTKSGFQPSDFTVTKEGHLAYTDWTIDIQKDGNIECLIILQGWIPRGICGTSTDELLVSMVSDKGQSKLVRYADSTVSQEIQYSEAGKPLYSDPGFITENKNGDIVVSDCDTQTVVVVNKEGKFKFAYDGTIRTKKPFNPRGVTTDIMCHILIADRDNHVIHVIDQNGQFLRYIDNCIWRNS